MVTMKHLLGFIYLRPKTSFCLAGFILVSHLLAAMALFLSDIHDMLRMLLLVMMLADSGWKGQGAAGDIMDITAEYTCPGHAEIQIER